MSYRSIKMGDIVRRRGTYRLGIVGYAAYSLGLACVTWERRLTHDIVKKKDLIVVATKKEAAAIEKLLEENSR